MKRKRQTRHDQCLKEQENPSSTKSFRSNISAKLQTLLNGFVSELQSISDDKRQDVTVLFSSKYKEGNCPEDTSTIKSALPSLVNSSNSNKVFPNFIDSAKSRISGLLNDKEQNQASNGNNSLKDFQSSQSRRKSLSIDPLETQINLKFQSLLFKAFDTKKVNHVDQKQDSTPSESISEKDLQDLSRMFENFKQSSKKKLQALTKDRNSQSLNSSVNVQDLLVKENQRSLSTRSSVIVNQRKFLNKDYRKPFVHQLNHSSHLPNISNKSSIKNAKILKMDFLNESSDSSSSPRNPFDENCMLLLSDAEKCPSYVDLNFSSESDEIENNSESPRSPVPESEPEDEVIVLGEKSKTYQEVTLDEDDEGQVRESVVEKVLEKSMKKEKEVEKPVFNCPICDKSYRAQSLLQFHIKMHAAENQSSKAPDNRCLNNSSSSDDESCSHERPMNSSLRVRKEKESAKISKISIKKNRREKYKRRRNKEISKSSL